MRHILLHGHIFKNAGTTFDWSLKQSFGRGFLDHREDELMRESGRVHLEQLVNEQPELVAVSSHHMTRDLPEISGVRFVGVNLLRHPIARFRSAYDFERKQRSDTPGPRAAKAMSFRDYVAWRMEPEVPRTIRNYQTVYMAGHHATVGNAEVADEHFAAALKNVGPKALLGLVERYDESMVLLEEDLRSYFPDIDLSYVAQNVSKKSRRKKPAGGAVAEVLNDLGDVAQRAIDENSFDLALYHKASLQLQSRIDRVDGFAQKLSDFRARQEKLGSGLSKLWKSRPW